MGAARASKTGKATAYGEYELFKTTAHFDSTAHNPQWLGGETPLTKRLADNAS